jgi:hypothetical protein
MDASITTEQAQKGGLSMFSSLPVSRYDVPTNPQRVLAGVVRNESAVLLLFEFLSYNNLTISIISLINYGGSAVL